MLTPVDLTRKRELQRDRSKRLYAERRVLIDKIKTDAGCIECGFDRHPAALQFDHRDPATKLFKIADGLSRNWEKVLAEIAKCDVRCANCHLVKTTNDPEIRRGRPRLPDGVPGAGTRFKGLDDEEILSRLESGELQVDVARDLGVHRQTISKACRRARLARQ